MSNLVARLRRRLRALTRGAALDAELQEEIRTHLDLEAEDLARGSALSPQEARRRALVAFGGVERVREEHLDARGVRWLADGVRDAAKLNNRAVFEIPELLDKLLRPGGDR